MFQFVWPHCASGTQIWVRQQWEVMMAGKELGSEESLAVRQGTGFELVGHGMTSKEGKFKAGN